MKKSRNDSLYTVGKYEQFTDSTNFKKANKLTKVRNFYLELACRPWCNAVAYPFLWVHGWRLIFSSHLMTVVTKHQPFAEWNVVYLLPISSFPISHFLAPTLEWPPALPHPEQVLVSCPNPLACARKRVWCSDRLFLSQLPDLRA